VGVLAAVVAALGWLPGAPAATIALPVLAAQYGAISALLPAATSDLAGSAGFGAAYGRVFSSWGIAGVLGPAAGGWLHRLTGTYTTAFRLCLVVAAIAAATLIPLRAATQRAGADR
jgi:MFS transporter, OFA family, oxalate/formate antiporter